MLDISYFYRNYNLVTPFTMSHISWQLSVYYLLHCILSYFKLQSMFLDPASSAHQSHREPSHSSPEAGWSSHCKTLKVNIRRWSSQCIFSQRLQATGSAPLQKAITADCDKGRISGVRIFGPSGRVTRNRLCHRTRCINFIIKLHHPRVKRTKSIVWLFAELLVWWHSVNPKSGERGAGHMQINLRREVSSALLSLRLCIPRTAELQSKSERYEQIDLDKLGNNFVRGCEDTQLVHVDAGTFVFAVTWFMNAGCLAGQIYKYQAEPFIFFYLHLSLCSSP